jgi:hypothetical protein
MKMILVPGRNAVAFALATLLGFFISSFQGNATSSLKFDGQWRFQLDPQNVGTSERWFERSLPGKIHLPGSLPAQGIGDDVSLETPWVGQIVDGNWFKRPVYAPYTNKNDFKFPFWLQPEKYFAGAAWYQCDLEIPNDWRGKRLLLWLERPHWETRVWLDGREIGSNHSLSTPHEYDLGTGIMPGKHELAIRVDNGVVVDVGINSHCISEHTQGNWNGIVGDILLRATEPVWIEDLQTFPSFAKQSVTIRGRIGNVSGQAGKGNLLVRVDEAVERGVFMPGSETKTVEVTWATNGGSFDFDVPVSDPKPWDEFQHNVYNASVEFAGAREPKVVSFGFRDLGTSGTQLTLNGRKVFIRGTLECCIFPKTGHPPTDTASWVRVMKAAKAHGLNNLRFHSYCPPEAAFSAADQEGVYLQVETCWANGSTTLGDGKPVDQWVYDETERILKAYGNHPSFLLMLYGNEPGGEKANAYLAKYVDHFKARDPRRFWSSGSGWPQLPENQFHVTPDPRIQAWGAGLKSRINALPPETRTDYHDYIKQRNVPVISHEIGQWCVYPNFDEIRKYTGYLKPKNFEIFSDTLRKKHMRQQARDFLIASGKLQTLCYKEDIESALRTPGMAGFQLLDLHDFPGQGTALVGVLDPFWEYKGYVTAAQFNRFCAETVPLARLDKRVFTSDETLRADLEIAHFGASPLKDIAVTWKIVNPTGRTMESGRFETDVVPIGNGFQVGSLAAKLSALPAPARYLLVVRVGPKFFESLPVRDKMTEYENDWDFWVYPQALTDPDPGSIRITRELDEAAIAALGDGEKVLWYVSPSRVRGDENGQVALGFSSIFWNTAWTDRQPPHTLGILCDPRHPALAEFPTESHSNWQWWYLITRAGAMILDGLPAELRPTVQVIDDWVTNRKLGLVFEGKVGRGKLLVCSIDLDSQPAEDVVARQMRHSLLQYMKSAKFRPKITLTPEQLVGLVLH